MFANIFFTKKKVPAFKSAFSNARNSSKTTSFIKSYILNDDDKPAKSLIGIRIYYVPIEEVKAGKIHEAKYEREAFVGLLPQDAYKLNKLIDKLLKEIA